MEYVLLMTFLTESGLKSNISVSGIKPDLSQAQVNSLMDTIIQKDVFLPSAGALVKKSGAQITQKAVTKIEIV